MSYLNLFPSRLFSLLLILVIASSAIAQEHFKTTSYSDRPQTPNGLSRDFWFAMVENYEMQGSGGKYYEIYVAAYASTTVNIALGMSQAQQFSVEASKVLVFRLPLEWEMKESGTIQPAVHVWSDDVDLNVQALSRNPATSDGMTVVPTVAWGNEYVVAAYHSYAYLPNADLPSEFAIVADQDETVVTITPSTDLRHGVASNVTYKRGLPFTVTLNRGEAVQYQASASMGVTEGYDVTGTRIMTSKPVGLVAGVQCANIPVEFPYCDHVCEMLLPIDRWGKTYHTVPFVQRTGGDGILVIASQDNTTIRREDAQGIRVHAILNKYELFYRYDVDQASTWTSDKPFMLAQYINGTDWPSQGANNGIGDPSMTIVAPAEQYTTKMILQAPTVSGGTGFVSHLNIVAPKGQEVLLDEKPLTVSPMVLDERYVAYRVSNIKPGVHVIESDSAIGSYIYGYGSYDSYAWPGSLGSFNIPSQDTSSPTITSMTQDCFRAHVSIADPVLNRTSQIAITPESTSNAEISAITYEGASKDSGSYDIRIVDYKQPAAVRVVITDGAGNRRTITHSYEPNFPQFEFQKYSYRAKSGTDTTVVISLRNNFQRSTGQISTSFKNGSAFAVITSPSEIEQNADASIGVRYSAKGNNVNQDTLLVTDGCWVVSVPITGESFEDGVLGVLPSSGISSLDRLTLSPNPASSTVQVRTDLGEVASSVMLAVLDLNGRVMLTRTISNLPVGFETELDISHLPNGAYFIEIASGERRIREKLTIER